MKLTRREAIAVSLMAIAGRPMQAKQNSDEDKYTLTLNPPSEGIYILLDQITFLELELGNKKVQITAQEIWDALNHKPVAVK